MRGEHFMDYAPYATAAVTGVAFLFGIGASIAIVENNNPEVAQIKRESPQPPQPVQELTDQERIAFQDQQITHANEVIKKQDARHSLDEFRDSMLGISFVFGGLTFVLFDRRQKGA